MDWQINGHKRQLDFIQKAINNGKLAHGYLFAGPNGVGKKTIAFRLAKELLENEGGLNKPKENYFHPDYLEVSGTNGIKIEQIRELTYKLALKPYSAKYKVAVIDDAHEMSTEAANALLKVLEEPKEHTIIILITSNPNRLPKTILSRIQKVTFGPIEKTDEKTDEMTLNFYEVFKNGKLIDKLVTASDISELESVEIKNMLQSWLVLMQKELYAEASIKLAKKISQVLQSYKYLEGNVNSKLLLTNLMLNS